jgi:electron transfer flavoprotein beta subunit
MVAVKCLVHYDVKVWTKSDRTGVDIENVKMSMKLFDEMSAEKAVNPEEAGMATETIAVSAGMANCRKRCARRLSVARTAQSSSSRTKNCNRLRSPSR